MINYVSYSNILQQFIEPLIHGDENDEEYMMKARIGQTAWNHCILDENEMLLDVEMKAAFKKLISESPEIKGVIDMLVQRKKAHFSEYQQFIFTVELRHKPDGSVNMYVESAPADKLGRK